GDVFDTLLNIDSRVVRTLPTLYFKPGFLSREYFAGRRVRYVTPFRLMFFLCLIAFFVMQVSFDNLNFAPKVQTSSGAFADAHTVAEVNAQEQRMLRKLDAGEANPAVPQVARAGLEVARAGVHRSAAARLKEIEREERGKSRAGASAAAASKASSSPPAGASSGKTTRNDEDNSNDIYINDSVWDPAHHPVRMSWLPGFANTWLATAELRMHDNLLAMKNGTMEQRRELAQRMFTGVFSLLPQTMFVLLPLFAVILKVFYTFKRRLYMEHLIVALHSHAFIFLSLLALFALAALKGLSSSAWLDVPVDLLTAAAWIWLFVYLYLMQKRVYMQGWILTTLKYWCVGICYTVLLSIAVGCAFVLSMART
ncbi:MAG: DUF3667 domain-containing protein, partial [Rhodanobacteraceae bacterium]